MAKIFSKTSTSTTSCSQKDMTDLVAKKAYDLYVKSGCKAGCDLDNFQRPAKSASAIGRGRNIPACVIAPIRLQSA